MSRKPKFNLSRDGVNVTVSLLNRDNKLASIYRARFQNEELVIIDQIDVDEETYVVESGWNAAFVVRYRELDLSINILEDNTDQTPPWWLAEPIGDTTFTASTSSFNPSWGSEVTYDTILVDNLQEGTKSQKKYTKA